MAENTINPENKEELDTIDETPPPPQAIKAIHGQKPALEKIQKQSATDKLALEVLEWELKIEQRKLLFKRAVIFIYLMTFFFFISFVAILYILLFKTDNFDWRIILLGFMCITPPTLIIYGMTRALYPKVGLDEPEIKSLKDLISEVVKNSGSNHS